jgi:hypothetical protein
VTFAAAPSVKSLTVLALRNFGVNQVPEKQFFTCNEMGLTSSKFSCRVYLFSAPAEIYIDI